MIKLVTFKTNHTIMGDVEEKNDTNVVIVKKPVQVVSVPPSPDNPQGGVAFSPFVEYASEFLTGFRIKYEDILMINTPVVELENQYNQIFGSGITIAKTLPKA
jgi:hypothetical protein